jgi:hypothetical protein
MSSRASEPECETEDLPVGLSMVLGDGSKGTRSCEDLEDDVQQASATCPL